MTLKDKTPKQDLNKIARKFGLAPAEDAAAELVAEMIHASGIGMYIKFLQSAAAMAKKQNKTLTWEHFIKSHDILARYQTDKE